MNRAEMSKQVLLYDQLAHAARDRSALLRRQLQEAAAAEYEQQGMAPTWRLPDVGTVVLPVSQDQIVCDDEDALIEWVARRAPAMVDTIRRVNPNHLASILTHAVAAEGVVIDPSTGEVIPGLVLRRGGVPQAITVRPSTAARDVARALADGVLERFDAALAGGGYDPR